MPPSADRIVVIDDDEAMRLACDQILTRSGFAVTTCADGATGLDEVARAHPALAVVDLKMPGLSGLEVIARLGEIAPDTVVVVITGYATIDTAVDAMRAGAYDFLPKPFSPEELRLIARRALERQRLAKAAQQAALERELLKRRFVTFVSHQLKTPLVAVHQYLDVLRRLEGTPEAETKRAEWLERCLARTHEMRRIVEDWLTLAQVEQGVLGRPAGPVDLKPLVQRVLSSQEPLAAALEVSLAAELPDARYVTYGDPTCLGVLLDNLVVNAIRYNRRHGAVRVTGSCEADGLTLAVIDTGIGIPAECVPRLFDDFYRVPGDARPTACGTGLGLPICKRIAEAMGATIEVESTPGRGSTFRVRMPRSAPDASVPGSEEVEP